MRDLNLKLVLTADDKGLRASIDASEKELRQFKRAADDASGITDDLGESSAKTAGSIRAMGAAAAAAAAAFSAWKAIKIADEFNILDQRIRSATKATGDYELVSRRLLEISRETGSALKTNVAIFQGLARAAGDAGASTQQVLALTEAMNMLGRIGGSTTADMENSMLQFTQAIGEGIVRAEEWNSVMSNTPEIAARIAEGLGHTVSEMRSLVNEGKILGTEVLASILKQVPEIREEFEAMPRSIEQATTALGDAWGKYIQGLDSAIGGSKTLVDLIEGATRALNHFMGDQLTVLEVRQSQIYDQIQSLDNLYNKLTMGEDERKSRLRVLNNQMTQVSKAIALVTRQMAVQEQVSGELDGALDGASGSANELDGGMKKLSGNLKKVVTAAKDAKDPLEDLKKTLQGYRDELSGVTREELDYLDAVVNVSDAVEAGLATDEEAGKILQMKADAIQEATDALDKNSKKLNENKQETAAWAKIVEQSIKRLDRAFVDLWRSAFEGFKDFKTALKDAFLDMLAELAHAAFTRKIVIQMSAMVNQVGGTGGGIGAPGAATSGGGADWGKLMQSGASIFKAAKGFFLGGSSIFGGSVGASSSVGAGAGAGATLGSTGGGALGAAHSSGGFASAGAGAASGAGGLALGVGAGIVGVAAGSLIGGALANSQEQKANASKGAMAGAAIGSIFGGFGAIIGGIIGGVAGSFIGDRTDPRWHLVTQPHGMRGGFEDDVYSVSPLGTFGLGGKSHGVKAKELKPLFDAIESVDEIIAEAIGPEAVERIQDWLEDQRNQKFIGIESDTYAKFGQEQFGEAIAERWAELLGHGGNEISTILSDFAKTLEGSAEEVLEEMATFALALGYVDAAVQEGGELFGSRGPTFETTTEAIDFIQKFTREGETLADTLIRLVDAVSSVTGITELFGMKFWAVGEDLVRASVEVVDAFGGMENMLAMTDFFYRNFFSEEERAGIQHRQARDIIGGFNEELGISGNLIDTKEELRAFVAGLDLTTEAGREAFVTAMELARAIQLLDDAALILEADIRAMAEVFAGIGPSLEGDRRDIEMSGLTGEERYEFIRAELDRKMLELATASSPEEFQRIFNESRELIREAWSGLSEEQRAAMKEDFLAMFDDFEVYAKEQAEALERRLERELELVKRQEITVELMNQAAANQIEAGQRMQGAALEFKAAVDTFPDRIVVNMQRSEVGL